MRVVLIGCVIIVACAGAQQNEPMRKSPRFKDYPATADFTGRPAKPLLVTTLEHTYRTTIRMQARKGPNFASRFTLAKWGCGSPCLRFVIIDARTGNIFDPGLVVGCADQNGLEASVDFKRASRLIAATGFSKQAGCGTDFYEWDGERLTPIGFRPRASGP
jgi:hypothetical protein